MSKYIIKNCLAIFTFKNLSNELIALCRYSHQIKPDLNYCENIPDCIMKQIVEKCKNAKIGYGGEPMLYASDILQMLEIQECER